MDKDKDDDEKFDKFVDEHYPEAYMYYSLGQLFRWTPAVIDELDYDLCRILIKLDKKVADEVRKESEEDQIGHRKPSVKTKPSFPEEWKDMKVDDIIKTEEFKKKLDQNEKIFNVMKRKHSVR